MLFLLHRVKNFVNFTYLLPSDKLAQNGHKPKRQCMILDGDMCILPVMVFGF